MSAWSRLGAGACALLSVLVAGCGGQPAVEEPMRADDQLESTRRIARAAFDSGRYPQAVGLYEETLRLALARDDLSAIIDARYNLAVALLNEGEFERALDVVTQAKAELQRAGRSPGMDLMLVEATLLYRNRRHEEARKVTDALLALSPPVSEDVAHGTWFLRGLIAVRTEDDALLAQAVEQVRNDRQPLARADYLELAGYQRLNDGDANGAQGGFELSAELRGPAGDYRGMVRTLAMAGEAAARAGRTRSAAGYYLRAGRSSALTGDSEAGAYLRRARDLADSAGDFETAAEAQQFLEEMEQSAI